MIRPLTGQVLIKVLPRDVLYEGGVTLPHYTITPEEQLQLDKKPTPPPPDICEVLAIGPWKTLKNGLKVLPPFPPGAKVLVREASGQKLHRDVGEKLKARPHR